MRTRKYDFTGRDKSQIGSGVQTQEIPGWNEMTKYEEARRGGPSQHKQRIKLSLSFHLRNLNPNVALTLRGTSLKLSGCVGGKWREHFARDKNASTEEVLDPEVGGWIRGQEVEKGV
jgi:hypothetical protein